MNKEILKSMSVLAVVCIVCTVLLSTVYVLTKPYVVKQQDLKANEKYSEIFPSGEFYPMDDFVKVFKGDLEIGKIKEVDVIGYGGNIKLLVGIQTNGKIQGVRVLEQAETPGLGAKIKLPEFLNQFIGKDESLELGEDIDSITGATISSEAVVEGVRKAFSGKIKINSKSEKSIDAVTKATKNYENNSNDNNLENSDSVTGATKYYTEDDKNNYEEEDYEKEEYEEEYKEEEDD